MGRAIGALVRSGIILVILFILIGIPIIVTIVNLIQLFKKKTRMAIVAEIITFVIGPAYTMILYNFWHPNDWTEAIYTGGLGGFGYYAPLASWHMPTVLFFCVIALWGYYVLRCRRHKISPLYAVGCISSLYIGCTISFFWILQISPLVGEVGIFLPIEGYLMCLFPLNFIILTTKLIYEIIQEDVKIYEVKRYENKILNGWQKLLMNSSMWPIAAFVLVWPILGIGMMILILFGQQADALVKAFTDTSDWLFSKQIGPAPEFYNNGHYLCTVAAEGHEKIVKPKRMGVRYGRLIVVNRQLCIANAFEELISDKLPRMHKIIRRVYDTYGYPLSKHIRTPLAADATYILMKPLEWGFLAVLYLCDSSPENRIHRQYLPIDIQKRLKNSSSGMI